MLKVTKLVTAKDRADEIVDDPELCRRVMEEIVPLLIVGCEPHAVKYYGRDGGTITREDS